MPRKAEQATKLSVSMAPEIGRALVAMAEKDGCSVAEVVRRSCALYRYLRALSADEELQVYNKRTKKTERLVLVS